jgi:hypothetical protein
MNCKSCLNEFNLSKEKPVTLLLCGHTICLKCAQTKLANEKRCPFCMEEILLFKSNYAMLDILECAKNISKEDLNLIDLNEEKKNFEDNNDNKNEKFFSANHKHLFEKFSQKEADAYWHCEGTHLFGNCKSNLDNSHFNFIFQTRYKCKKCIEFNLCEACLRAPKKPPTEYFYSKNHPHHMNKCKRDNGWACNGRNVFGKCKSNLNDFGLSVGKTRYKCVICNDFDFCQSCLTAPKLNKYKTANHVHEFKEWTVNEDEFECKGVALFGVCKSTMSQRSDKELKFKCVKCYEYILCKACLDEPEKEKFKTPHHQHAFEECFKSSNWRCDGKSIFGECKMGLDKRFANKQPRYKCLTCDNFDLCKECLFSTEPIINYKSPHHKHELVECVISKSDDINDDDHDDDEQFCSGLYLFGKCKKLTKTPASKKYVCTKCSYFELCKNCFDEPETKSYTTLNHHPETHVFKEFFKKTGWRCDGNSIFGKCKLRLHRNADNHTRFKCMMCEDFDLCEACLNAPDKRLALDINENLIDLSTLFNNENCSQNDI